MVRTVEERKAASSRQTLRDEAHRSRVKEALYEELKRPAFRFLMAYYVYDLCGLEQVFDVGVPLHTACNEGRRQIGAEILDEAFATHPEMVRRMQNERLRELEKENAGRSNNDDD